MAEYNHLFRQDIRESSQSIHHAYLLDANIVPSEGYVAYQLCRDLGVHKVVKGCTAVRKTFKNNYNLEGNQSMQSKNA